MRRGSEVRQPASMRTRPSQEIGASLKLVQACKRRKHRFLYRILGVLRAGKNL